MKLQARILIMNEAVMKPIYITDNHEEIKKLFLEKSPDDIAAWDIEVGDKIFIQGEELTIEGFSVRVLKQTFEIPDNGYTPRNAGENGPYNIDFIFYVDEKANKLR